MVNLDQFRKEKLSKHVDQNPYVQNVYKKQLKDAKKQIHQLQTRLQRRRRGVDEVSPSDAGDKRGKESHRPGTAPARNTAASSNGAKSNQAEERDTEEFKTVRFDVRTALFCSMSVFVTFFVVHCL